MPSSSSAVTLPAAARHRGAFEAPGEHAEAMRHFAGKVAHDYNNYLTAFLGYGELLEGVLEEDSKARRYLREMLVAGQKARVFTQQLQAYSGRQLLDLRPVQLNDLVSACVEALRTGLPEHVSVEVTLDASAGAVEVDADQFQLVVLALAEDVAGALEGGESLHVATMSGGPGPSGGLTVELSSVPAPREDEHVETEGYFEPFSDAAGVKVGLKRAAARGTVIQHGGRIEVTSTRGGGRTVRIHLPGYA